MKRSPLAIASLINGTADPPAPGVVNWIPLSVSTVWIRYGTASIRRSKKSREVAVLAVSCSSTKANLLGGLFTTYALLARPDAFATLLPISPSLWWDGFAVLSHLPAFTEKLTTLSRQPRVFVGVGAKEQDLPTKVPPMLNMSLEEVQALVIASRMVDAAEEFAAALRTAGLNEIGYAAFQGEDHGSVLAVALMRGLAFAVPDLK